MDIVEKVLREYSEGKYRVQYILGDPMLVDNETNVIFVPDEEYADEFYERLDELFSDV